MSLTPSATFRHTIDISFKRKRCVENRRNVQSKVSDYCDENCDEDEVTSDEPLSEDLGDRFSGVDSDIDNSNNDPQVSAVNVRNIIQHLSSKKCEDKYGEDEEEFIADILKINNHVSSVLLYPVKPLDVSLDHKFEECSAEDLKLRRIFNEVHSLDEILSHPVNSFDAPGVNLAEEEALVDQSDDSSCGSFDENLNPLGNELLNLIESCDESSEKEDKQEDDSEKLPVEGNFKFDDYCENNNEPMVNIRVEKLKNAAASQIGFKNLESDESSIFADIVKAEPQIFLHSVHRKSFQDRLETFTDEYNYMMKRGAKSPIAERVHRGTLAHCWKADMELFQEVHPETVQRVRDQQEQQQQDHPSNQPVKAAADSNIRGF